MFALYVYQEKIYSFQMPEFNNKGTPFSIHLLEQHNEGICEFDIDDE